jgi:hypothetical protein
MVHKNEIKINCPKIYRFHEPKKKIKKKKRILFKNCITDAKKLNSEGSIFLGLEYNNYYDYLKFGNFYYCNNKKLTKIFGDVIRSKNCR